MFVGIGLALTKPSGKGGPPLFPPVNTVAPVVSGTPTEGQVLSCTQGTWSPAGTSYAYQWRRDGTPIGGATSATYTLVTADVGALVSCAVTATNTDGSASATSNSLGPVAAAPTGPTYADFVASITAKAVDGSKSWTSAIGNGAALKVITTAATPGGSMDGSSWNDATGFDSSGASYARIVQHALPDNGVTFNENVSSGRVVYMEAVASSLVTAPLTGKTRNGYTSNTAPSPDLVNVRRVTLAAWWDAALGKALQSNPSVGGAPTDYAY